MAKPKEQPPKVGRKPRAGEAGSMIGIRVTTAEREDYEAAAAEKDMTLAEWIRYCCAQVLKRARR